MDITCTQTKVRCKRNFNMNFSIFLLRIQTNIWLYTDRANISLPVTISFVWPSVLEDMSSSFSRAPLILDFQVIFLNITKVSYSLK
jgi:hypothetical protein